ncbi:MAG: hypothetical protein AAF959_22760 [Cyanobacteria bacterium P01_D01_bin.56]
MEPSPLHFVSHTHYYRGGDVVVDASAAVAPGVVFRAAPGASIRIGPGVCVGAGVVIQARQGCVFIESGVSLGTGVLIVGHGHVGKEACVGPSSTLMNPAIAANEIVPPCSLMRSAQVEATSTTQQESPSQFQAPNFHASQNGSAVPSMPIPPRTSPTVQPQAVSPKAVNVPDVDTSTYSFNEKNGGDSVKNNNTGASSSAVVPQNGHVYGRDHLNNLLSALFPHRQPLDNGDKSGHS